MDISTWPARADFPIAKPGFTYIIAAFVLTGLLFFAGLAVCGGVSLLVALFMVWFFRDPNRRLPEDDTAVVSPADGRVLSAEQVSENQYIKGACVRVSIFMNIFNVHVNRIPFGGRIEAQDYFPGSFINASFDKASEKNERNALIIRSEKGHVYGVVQIAGLIARRIVSRVCKGDSIKTGERYGMICFGSRLEVYLPQDIVLAVKPGEKVNAGSTIIGYLT
ncbi:MAG: phosphatidylserine decarboxylase family protein [Thermodesulfobacteriota bacterium]|nr:phosphatidylserine decarboxylase family protein [Thermodesulfobacteriota bacterium]